MSKQKTLWQRIKNWAKKQILPQEAPQKIFLLEEVLNNICEIAKTSFPKECVMFLQGKNRKIHNVWTVEITGLYVIPYIANQTSTHFQLYDLPTVHHSVGSVHSHPSSNTQWSRADLQLFQKFGWVHAIIGAPYRQENIVFYDKNGNRMHFSVVKEIH